MLKSNFNVNNGVMINAFFFQEDLSLEIFSDPDLDPTYQVISDPDPGKQKFWILADPVPQHCWNRK